MKIIKRLIPFLLFLMLSACTLGGDSEEGKETEPTPTVPNSSVTERIEDEIDGSTKTITDSSGREVVIPDEIERVATLYSPTGHMLALFGQGDKIVASPGGLQRDVLMIEMYPSVLDAAVPKQSGKTNVEELARMNPDLIFIDKEMLMDEGERRKFDQLKIPYVVIDFFSIEEQMRTAQLVGEIFNDREKADDYVTYYEDMIEMVSERVADIPQEERVRVYHSINEATRTSAPDTLSNEWLQIAGAINVALEDELKFTGSKYFASVEQIYVWDPEVIIVNEAGVDEYLLTKDQWRNLQAIKDERVHLLPNGLTRWGHPGSIEVPLAILFTAKLLYPDHFTDINLDGEVKKFYEDFFSFTLTDEQTVDILSGGGMRFAKGEE